MTRLRRLRCAIELHVRTDWPVWAVFSAAAIAGAMAGWHYGLAAGLMASGATGILLTWAMLAAEASGRREERDRRRR